MLQCLPLGTLHVLHVVARSSDLAAAHVLVGPNTAVQVDLLVTGAGRVYLCVQHSCSAHSNFRICAEAASAVCVRAGAVAGAVAVCPAGRLAAGCWLAGWLAWADWLARFSAETAWATMPLRHTLQPPRRRWLSPGLPASPGLCGSLAVGGGLLSGVAVSGFTAPASSAAAPCRNERKQHRSSSPNSGSGRAAVPCHVLTCAQTGVIGAVILGAAAWRPLGALVRVNIATSQWTGSEARMENTT